MVVFGLLVGLLLSCSARFEKRRLRKGVYRLAAELAALGFRVEGLLFAGMSF